MVFSLLRLHCRKKSAVLLLLLMGSHFLQQPAFPQVDRLKKLKEIKKTTDDIRNIRNLNDAAGFLKERLVEYLKKHKDEFDKTDLNYAVSYSENSGMYETEEKFDRMRKTLLYVLDPSSMENRSEKEQAADYNDGGELAYATGRFRMAEKMFLASKLTCESAGMYNDPLYSMVLGNLGLLYMTMGKYNLAEEYSMQALELRRNNPDDRKGLAASMNNLAVLYQSQGKYTEADDAITEAQKLARDAEGPKSTAYAITLNNQAILYQLTGKYDDAERLLKQSIAIAEEELGKRSPNFIRIKINLALLYQLQERYHEAEKIFLEAIDVKKKRLGTSHPDYAILLQDLASLYQEKGEYTRVESLLKEALGIYRKKFGEKHPAVASAKYDLARYYQYAGQTSEALPVLKSALETQTELLGEHHPSTAATIESMAVLYWQTGDLSSARSFYSRVIDEYLGQVRSYFPAMSEYDKTRFWDKISPKLIRYYSFAEEAGSQYHDITGQMFNLRIATKALLLSTTTRIRQMILDSPDASLKARYKQWLDLKEYIARLYGKSKEELRNEQINLDSLEQTANSLEKELSRQSDIFASGFRLNQLTWNDLAATLKPDEACIELIRYRNYRGIRPDTAVHYTALILKNNGKPPVQVTIPEGNLLESEIIALYRSAMQNAQKEAPYRPAFWKGIDRETKEIKRLYISADGVYNQINIGTLQEQGGRFLTEEKEIVYLTNSREVVDLKKPSGTAPFGSKTAVLIGNPHYSKGLVWEKVKTSPLPELPGTEKEITLIEKQLKPAGWKITRLAGDEATETNLKKQNSPALLHIATHGFFLEDPPETEEKVFGIEPVKASRNPLLRSGLMFAGADNTIQQAGSTAQASDDDGILNAYEASLLPLHHTELVVLSACETGLGETKNGEGVYGLQRAFEMAGARALIISLWEVSDEVTQQLMNTFFKYWLQLGDKRQAFQKAQLDIKKAHPEPFFWGAFIMLGK